MRKLLTLALLLLSITSLAQVRDTAKQVQDTVKKASTAAKPAAKKEAMVLICLSKSSYAYHSYRCSGLSRCKAGTSSVTVTEAKNRGYRACKLCY